MARYVVTIDHGKVGDDLADFPVYVRLSDVGVTTLAEARSIRCYEADGTTELAREVVSETELWVKTDLSSTADTEIVIDWDGARPDYDADDDYGAQAVWGNGFAAVWHLSNTDDSTGAWPLTLVDATATAGQVGGAYAFERGETTYLETSDPARDIFDVESVTFSFWAKPSSLPSAVVMAVDGGALASRGLGVIHQSGAWMAYQDATYSGIAPSTMDVWQHMVVTSDGEDLIAYRDGAYSTLNQMSTVRANAAQPLRIGQQAKGIDANRGWNGLLDEVRISNVVRDADWIATEYANQSDPDTFYAAAEAQEPAPASRGSLFGELAGAEIALLELAGDGQASDAHIGRGQITWQGQAEGTGVASARAAGAFSWDDQAEVADLQRARAQGEFPWDGQADGAGLGSGRAADAYAWDGQAEASDTASARAAGDFAWDGAADGAADAEARAAGEFAWDGAVYTSGSASGRARDSFGWTGQATGTGIATARAAGEFAWDAKAEATDQQSARAAGEFAWDGTANGAASAGAKAAGEFAWGGKTAGKSWTSARAAGEFVWDGQATGSATAEARAAGEYSWDGTATGGLQTPARAVGEFSWSDQADGAALKTARAAGRFAWSSAADGSMFAGARAAGQFLWLGAAEGGMTTSALAFAAVEWVGRTGGVAFYDSLLPSHVQFGVPPQAELVQVAAQTAMTEVATQADMQVAEQAEFAEVD